MPWRKNQNVISGTLRSAPDLAPVTRISRPNEAIIAQLRGRLFRIGLDCPNGLWQSVRPKTRLANPLCRLIMLIERWSWQWAIGRGKRAPTDKTYDKDTLSHRIKLQFERVCVWAKQSTSHKGVEWNAILWMPRDQCSISEAKVLRERVACSEIRPQHTWRAEKHSVDIMWRWAQTIEAIIMP